ncbi:MAG: hypothetical protein MJ137_02290 [Clostridia bacterium]|nr:hypothetical protein [Clostridia bacterium]
MKGPGCKTDPALNNACFGKKICQKAERDIKIAMLENSGRKYLLANKSKTDNTYPFRIIKTAELDAVIHE